MEAGREFGLPLSGTMAHSFIEAHDHETDAFRDFLSARARDTSLRVSDRLGELAARLDAAED